MTNEYFENIAFDRGGKEEEFDEKLKSKNNIERWQIDLDVIKEFLARCMEDNSNFEIDYFLEMLYEKIKLSFLILVEEINNCDNLGCDLRKKYKEYELLVKQTEIAVESLRKTIVRGKIEPQKEVLEFLEKINNLKNLIEYKKRIGN